MKTSNLAEVYIQETAAMRGVRQEFPSRVKSRSKQLLIPQVPIEWLDASSWRLPSGKALAEFALQAGFLAPLLFKTETFTARGARRHALASKQLEKEGNR
jgi:hypothetical protein